MYSRAKGIADHYWPQIVFFFHLNQRRAVTLKGTLSCRTQRVNFTYPSIPVKPIFPIGSAVQKTDIESSWVRRREADV